MDYKEVTRNSAIDFSITIDGYIYKGSYKYNIDGVITGFTGGIYENDKFVGNFSRDDDSGNLNITGVSTENLLTQATNSKSVIDYVIALVKTATTTNSTTAAR
jgi:hypothetical protein